MNQRIYGVAILAACYLVGKLMGDVLGILLDIDGNVGGVGFAMALLIGINTVYQKELTVASRTRDGILFWSGMYIPIVVAMSASQNVKAALTGGWVAVIVGIGCTFVCFLLVPVLSKIGKDHSITKSEEA
jgi:malonate transporter MadL subunit